GGTPDPPPSPPPWWTGWSPAASCPGTPRWAAPGSGTLWVMAESAQRIIGRRALDGQHPHSAEAVMAWLAATVRGWNAAPTVFAWGGKRQQRRWRARQ